MQAQLDELLGWAAEVAAPQAPPKPGRRGRKKRKISAQGSANLRAGVARRVGKPAAGVEVKPGPKSGRGKLSPAGRKALSKKLKARWAARKAAGKARL
jgi:hypothetical protein